MNDIATTPDVKRRGFLKGAAAAVLGAAAALVPSITGLVAFLAPLRRRADSLDAVRVTLLEALPDDGLPRRFTITATRTDAWNRTPDTPVGAVFLRRLSGNQVEALNVVCPHAGCLVDFVSERKAFLCPCHNSTFAIDGKINDPRSPSPRPLDALAVEVRDNREVWVRFRNFVPGHKDQIPAS